MTEEVRLIRAWTPSDQKLAAGIVAGLSYADIGKEMGVSSRTVRARVDGMSQSIFGLDDLPPRWAVYVFWRFCQWKGERSR